MQKLVGFSILSILSLGGGSLSGDPLSLRGFYDIGAYSETLESVAVAPQVKVPVELTLRESSRISKSRIYLIDLLENCKGFQDICEILKGIDLGETLDPGQSKWISSKSVREIVEDEEVGINLQLISPDRIHIKAAQVKFDTAAIKYSLKKELTSLEDHFNIRIEVHHFRLAHIPLLRSGKFKIVFDFLDSNVEPLNWFKELHGKPKGLSARLIFEDREQQPVRVSFFTTFELWHEVPVAKRTLLPNQKVHRAEIGYAFKPYSVGVFETEDEIVGKIIKTRVPAGSVFKQSAVKSRQLVRRGQKVKIYIKKGALTLGGKGKALKDGSFGEVIPVQNEKGKKRLSARVVKQGVVEVEL